MHNLSYNLYSTRHDELSDTFYPILYVMTYKAASIALCTHTHTRAHYQVVKTMTRQGNFYHYVQ